MQCTLHMITVLTFDSGKSLQIINVEKHKTQKMRNMDTFVDKSIIVKVNTYLP
jgi:hypothetical protein